MWKLLPWSGRGASGYPQRQCFFCCTTSIILPPYKPDATSSNVRSSSDNGHASHPSNLATSSTTTISTGTPTNWFCSSCHCQNVATEDGIPVEQYTRPMWDEEWNRDRSQLMRHTRPQASGTKVLSISSPNQRTVFPGNEVRGQDRFAFCHTCQTNQVLTLNMLADYLPDEDDAEYQAKLEHLAEYEASIASRYPPVCSDCAPKVQERITERDQFARSWSLGKWLDLKKKASFADIADMHNHTSPIKTTRPTQAAPIAEQAISHRSVWNSVKAHFGNLFSLEDGSPFVMVLFFLVNLSIWCFYLATSLDHLAIASTLQDTAERIQAEPISLFTAVVVAFMLFCLPKLLIKCYQMDPLKRSIDRARARQIRVEAKGVGLWQTTQLVILVLRLCALLVTVYTTVQPNKLTHALLWLEATLRKDSASLLRLAAFSMLSSELTLTAFAASKLRVQLPSPLQLVSRPVIASGRQGKSIEMEADPLLKSLSLDDQVTRPSFAFSQTNGFDKPSLETAMEDGITLPPPQRDADGDAVMEDAATYSARRMSQSSDEDWDHNSRVPPPPAASWSQNWSRVAPQQPNIPSSSNANGSQRYPDFQLGPQRFWEPQNPTGLEDVFGRAVSLDDQPSNNHDRNTDDASGKWSKWFGFS
ncbi:uncharacterized protein UTRI_00883_B [Ustilago trichophora]|uniref:Ima1 N-terminal domain-containing protein n=1 Tax=Ustilago trichophora TaxID=86804 RepID=A0A5C3DTJ9_9BASI|nr:uncharacterized protein UTRI_00883_B [Ustilago trichophora]